MPIIEKRLAESELKTTELEDYSDKESWKNKQ